MGGAVVHGLLGVVVLEEAEDQAGGEAVAAADAVEDLEFRELDAVVELAVVPADGAPVVLRGGDHAAERGRGDLEVRELLHGLGDHVLEGLGLDVGDVVVDALDLEAEGGGEVLLVADHHVDILGDLAVHFLGLLEAADGLPEGRAVVQVVGDDGAVLLRGLDGLDGGLRGGLGEGREDAARVEPADAELAEEVLPVEVAGLDLRGRGVAAVRDADGAADAEAALGEVEAVADRAADAVVLAPLDEVGVHAALHHEVLEQAADLVVDERRADGGAQAEALAQAAGDVVFAAAFPDLELARGAHAAFARVEAEHDFTEGDLVEGAFLRRLDLESHGRRSGGLEVSALSPWAGRRGRTAYG